MQVRSLRVPTAVEYVLVAFDSEHHEHTVYDIRSPILGADAVVYLVSWMIILAHNCCCHRYNIIDIISMVVADQLNGTGQWKL